MCVRTRVDVLNAEPPLFATRKDLASARYKTLVAVLQLKVAAGSLAEADLRALDALLQIKSNCKASGWRQKRAWDCRTTEKHPHQASGTSPAPPPDAPPRNSPDSSHPKRHP